MFGYVNPDKPELKIREFEVYRSYYCAVCKAIGRRSGQIPRLVLNYDLAFLALLLDALDAKPNMSRLERCIAHPIRKHAIAVSNPVIEYSADMNVLLAYYSLKDQWHDDRSLPGAAGMIALSYSAKKAGLRWQVQSEMMKAELEKLQSLENSRCPQIDEAAEPFAKIMETLFSFPDIEDDATKKGLSWLGYNLGRWIYLVDAVDDLEDDVKNQNYNPILIQYGFGYGDFQNESVQSFRKRIEEKLEFSLFYTLSEVDKSLKVLHIKKNEPLLENIIESGLANKSNIILRGCKESHE